MALTDCVEINIANNAKLRANVQHIFTFTRAIKPLNIFLIYNPKQKEFKVKRT